MIIEDHKLIHNLTLIDPTFKQACNSISGKVLIQPHTGHSFSIITHIPGKIVTQHFRVHYNRPRGFIGEYYGIPDCCNVGKKTQEDRDKKPNDLHLAKATELQKELPFFPCESCANKTLEELRGELLAKRQAPYDYVHRRDVGLGIDEARRRRDYDAAAKLDDELSMFHYQDLVHWTQPGCEGKIEWRGRTDIPTSALAEHFHRAF